MLFNTPK